MWIGSVAVGLLLKPMEEQNGFPHDQGAEEKEEETGVPVLPSRPFPQETKNLPPGPTSEGFCHLPQLRPGNQTFNTQVFEGHSRSRL